MITIPQSNVKLRDELETEVSKFIKAGGKVEQLPCTHDRMIKEKYVKTSLFYSIHHPFHARKTGISQARLKTIQKIPAKATEDEINKLWKYFRSREWSTYGY